MPRAQVAEWDTEFRKMTICEDGLMTFPSSRVNSQASPSTRALLCVTSLCLGWWPELLGQITRVQELEHPPARFRQWTTSAKSHPHQGALSTHQAGCRKILNKCSSAALRPAPRGNETLTTRTLRENSAQSQGSSPRTSEQRPGEPTGMAQRHTQLVSGGLHSKDVA